MTKDHSARELTEAAQGTKRKWWQPDCSPEEFARRVAAAFKCEDCEKPIEPHEAYIVWPDGPRTHRTCDLKHR